MTLFQIGLEAYVEYEIEAADENAAIETAMNMADAVGTEWEVSYAGPVQAPDAAA
jgi:hypothetical protein